SRVVRGIDIQFRLRKLQRSLLESVAYGDITAQIHALVEPVDENSGYGRHLILDVTAFSLHYGSQRQQFMYCEAAFVDGFSPGLQFSGCHIQHRLCDALYGRVFLRDEISLWIKISFQRIHHSISKYGIAEEPVLVYQLSEIGRISPLGYYLLS